MTDLQRLLHDRPTDLEEELLRAAADEPIPHELRQRMAAGVAATFSKWTDPRVDFNDGQPAPTESTAPTAQGPSVGSPAANTAANGGSAMTPSLFNGSALLKGVVAAVAAGAVGLGIAAWPTDRGSLPAAFDPTHRAEHPALPATPTADGNAELGQASATPLTATNLPARDLPSNALPSNALPADAASRLAQPLAAEPARLGSSSVGANAGRVRSDAQPTTPDKTSSRASESARSGDVGAELQLLDAARRAIVNGQLSVAQRKLADYSARFPEGILRAEAAALGRVASGDSKPITPSADTGKATATSPSRSSDPVGEK